MVKKQKGVTLIELLIVVLILAALAAIAIPRISQSAANAKIRTCETNIDIMNQTIERYYLANEKYPANLEVIQVDTNLFPDGPLWCAITGAKYSEMTAEHRVNASAHKH